MHKKDAQASIGVLIFLLFFIVIIFLSISKTTQQLLPIIFLFVPFVIIITFTNTDAALILLIFSMLLSPELKLIDVPQRAVVVRVDDILLIVVFFSWLAKMAINKELGLLKNTPLNLPIAAYILIYILSTGIGIMAGNISPVKSFFYILKFIEFFMLFFMVVNNVRNKEQIKIFIAVLLITCAITSSYALLTVGPFGRATAPFEGVHGEPNTLGGYLVLLFAITSGIFLYSPSRIWRFCCGALACFIFITLLQTLSRGSYLSFIPMYLTLVILTRKKKVLLMGILILGILILPAMVPIRITERVTKTFIPGRVFEPFGRRITLDQSAAARVYSWKRVLEQWTRRPVLGYGVTGVGLVDTQYPRVLGETGIIGFLIFIWLLTEIYRHSLYTFNNIEDEWLRGLTLGFLAGFVGLLIHSFAANTFIIVRIMEPFWFLAAVVIILPKLQELYGTHQIGTTPDSSV